MIKRLFVFLALLALPALAEPLKLSVSVAEAVCKIGTAPVCTLELENTSARPLSLTYFRPTFWYPDIVALADSRKIPLQVVPYNGPAQPVKLTIGAHEKVQLPADPFYLFARPASREELRAYAVVTPGRYRLSYRIQLDQWNLQSNVVGLEVTP